MKQLHFFFFVALCSVLSFSACKPDKDPQPQGGAYSNGHFVVCEGSFNNNNAEITFIDENGSVTEQVFKTVNNRPLGDVLQSLTIVDSLAFIVVNNSQKIEVVNSGTFKSKKTLNDERFTFPRYIQKLNDNQILLTNGTGYGDDAVFVINSKTFEIEQTIATGAGPNQMIVHNGKIFVANFGGYTNDSTVTVINAGTLSVERTITVGDMPAGMILDKDGNILILCKGLTTYDAEWNETPVSNSKIVKLNTTTLVAKDMYQYDRQIKNFSSNLISYANNTLYVLDDDAVYSFGSDFGAPQKIVDGGFYGISIIGTDMWLCDSNPTAPRVVQYSLSGAKIAEYTTAPFPNAVVESK
ncbi:MAG: hypothetical protein LBM68_01840 [Bacteroidales bacterium]|jgi:YVTN family beta-propeller protein|nr:hypothetical protein [Bacteroidales bacterium]